MIRTSIRFVACLSVLVAACHSGPRGPKSPDREIDFKGARLHYVDVGVGPDVLVLVHGWGCDAGSWQKQLRDPRGRRLIAIDLPGHGRSELPEKTLTMDLFARAVADVMDDAKVERAVLVGHSNGAPVVRQFWRRFPERTRGLVIVDGALKSMFSPEQAEQAVVALGGPNAGEQVAKFFVDPMLAPMRDAADRDAMRATMLSCPVRTQVEGMRAAVDPAIWGDDTIDVPVLALMSRAPFWDDAYEAHARRIAPQLVWKGFDTSHFVMLDDPEGVERALDEWLPGVPR
jgi:pimeloyl-ACP methyl ester carboxylesterase